MADNVTANAGSGGAVFATDQRASDSVHFPLTKLVWGALDTFTVVDTGSGALPIQDGGNSITIDAASLPLPTGASTAAKQPALGTAGSASADVLTVQGIASMTALKVDGSAVTQPVSMATNTPVGNVAHDAADSGAPLKIGAKATTALSGLTLVADADRTDLLAGIDGVQITRPHTNLESVTSGVAAITDGSSTSVIAAAGAGVKTYITSVVIANSSSSNVTVDLRDGTAGSVKATFPVPANGGVVLSLPVPLGFTANTAVAADPSAAASTVTVTLVGFKSKV